MKKEYFLHPTLLIAGGALVMWLGWSKVPSPQQVHEAEVVPQTQKALPDPSQLRSITGLTIEGNLLLEGAESWPIKNSRFQSLDETQAEKLRAFLVGKKIRLPRAKEKALRLPIELYDPLCFSSPRPEKLACPVILQP